MIKYIDDPLAARKMEARDVLEVAVFYDKYEFTDGLQLCEEVLTEYFNSLADTEKKFTLDLDLVVDLAVVSPEANLDKASKIVIDYLWSSMQNKTCCLYGRTMFSEEHVKKLLPVLKYSRDSLGYDASQFMGNSYDDTEINLDDQTFPKDFVVGCQREEQHYLLDLCLKHIHGAGSGCKADGLYSFDLGAREALDDFQGRQDTWNGQTVTFGIKFINDLEDFCGWAIVRNPEDGMDVVGKICWVALHSRNSVIPPLTGWVPSDSHARGNPKLKYIFKHSVNAEEFCDRKDRNYYI